MGGVTAFCIRLGYIIKSSVEIMLGQTVLCNNFSFLSYLSAPKVFPKELECEEKFAKNNQESLCTTHLCHSSSKEEDVL